MSDPVKNAEVEDVLSSIRRLVSEDKRPLQANKPAAAPDRLVLTPALRVEDNAVPEAAEQEAEVEPLALEETVDPSGGSASDQFVWQNQVQRHKANNAEASKTVADPDATAQAHADNYDDDPYGFEDDAADADTPTVEQTLTTGGTSQGNQPEEPRADEHDTRVAQNADDNALDETLHEASQDAATSSVSEAMEYERVSRSKAAALSAKIAALETVIGDISDEWEPDGTSSDAYAGSEPQAMAWEDDTSEDDLADVMFHHHAEDADASEIEEAVMLPSDKVAIDDDTSDTFTADSAEPEHMQTDALEALTDQPEVAATTKAKAETLEAAPAEASTEAEATEPTEDQSVSDEKAGDGFDLSAEDQLLDEDALRDMISEIVHGELQGALGERITRNVRRLVRREIHRALTARDLD